ncbi:MAG: Crp/Fnr family transcriptional regulator [Cryomorphaceae bacterium]|nr:Crp/Fnr family transcriptional regulator [Cryomorphaceae bacterium]
MTHYTVEELKRIFPSFGLPLIEELSKEAVFMEVGKGQIVSQPSSYVKNGMMLVEGLLKVYRQGEDGSSFFVYYLNPGEVCSMSVSCGLYDRRFNVKAIAEEDCVLISVEPKFLRSWMTKYPEWVEYIIGSYRMRFEKLLDVLDQISFLKLDERLVSYLKRRREKSNDRFTIEASHQEIANDLNSTREVISRLLKSMENDGLLETGRGKLTLLSQFDQQYG